jgi:hypothetical protein
VRGTFGGSGHSRKYGKLLLVGVKETITHSSMEIGMLLSTLGHNGITSLVKSIAFVKNGMSYTGFSKLCAINDRGASGRLYESTKTDEHRSGNASVKVHRR